MVTDTTIKKGYKQTEIGVIPEDWNVVRLNLLSNDIGDGIHSTPKYVDSSNYFFVNGNNLSDGRILITRDTKCISEDEYESLKKNLDNTTILMSINGTIGNLAFFNNETVVLGKSAAYIKLSQRIDKIFIYYLLQHSSIKKFYDNELTGTTIKNLSLASIRSTPIPIPPTKPEQTAIATVLSDTDALIEHLEKLITKRKAIKQGAMQQLLTGKKRLPGFSGEWEAKKLGKIAEIKTGNKDNDDKVEEGLYPFFVRSQQVERINSYSFDGEAILIPGEGNIGSIYHYINSRFDYHQRVYKISNFAKQYSGKYIYYYMSQNFNFYAVKNSVKATVDSLRLPTFQEFEILFPSTKNEQTAIATILSDMDSEIEKLEKKRDKYIMLKQGMMQQLLTGRIRIYANN